MQRSSEGILLENSSSAITTSEYVLYPKCIMENVQKRHICGSVSLRMH
jgi:hypothetical protein